MSTTLLKNSSEHLQDTFFALFNAFPVNAVLSFSMTILFFLFGANHADALFALTALVALDLITGIWAAKKTGEVISSKEGLRTPIKFMMYLLLCSASHLAEVVIPGTFFVFEMMTSFLAIRELISIMENASKAGYEVPMKLLNKLQEMRDAK